MSETYLIPTYIIPTCTGNMCLYSSTLRTLNKEGSFLFLLLPFLCEKQCSREIPNWIEELQYTAIWSSQILQLLRWWSVQFGVEHKSKKIMQAIMIYQFTYEHVLCSRWWAWDTATKAKRKVLWEKYLPKFENGKFCQSPAWMLFRLKRTLHSTRNIKGWSEILNLPLFIPHFPTLYRALPAMTSDKKLWRNLQAKNRIGILYAAG